MSPLRSKNKQENSPKWHRLLIRGRPLLGDPLGLLARSPAGEGERWNERGMFRFRESREYLLRAGGRKPRHGELNYVDALGNELLLVTG